MPTEEDVMTMMEEQERILKNTALQLNKEKNGVTPIGGYSVSLKKHLYRVCPFQHGLFYYNENSLHGEQIFCIKKNLAFTVRGKGWQISFFMQLKLPLCNDFRLFKNLIQFFYKRNNIGSTSDFVIENKCYRKDFFCA